MSAVATKVELAALTSRGTSASAAARTRAAQGIALTATNRARTTPRLVLRTFLFAMSSTTTTSMSLFNWIFSKERRLSKRCLWRSAARTTSLAGIHSILTSLEVEKQ